MASMYNKILEKVGDVLDKTAAKDFGGNDHFFISVSQDDSQCVTVTHSTGANKGGRVPSNISGDEVVRWYVQSNYAVGDHRLIFVDANQLFTAPVRYLRGGGCIDASKTHDVKSKDVIARVKPEILGVINQALSRKSLRGLYWDNGIKDVYNKQCYKWFLDSRGYALSKLKGYVNATVTDSGIVLEWNGDYYVDEVRNEVEMTIASPLYNVYKYSDARAKGNFELIITK